ncbi:MAG: hypothetical protein Q8K23_05925 [Sulfuritalea sp.]|nr:hypothetical protein [Sulfuritalea sp.]
MKLHAKRVSAIASGDYYQVLLDSEGSEEEQLSPFDPPAPYLMVQRQFEFFEGGKCYVESDDDEYIGHFKLKLIEFSPTRLAFEIARQEHNHVEVSFALTAVEFDEALPIVEVIFGIREPDNDGQDADGPALKQNGSSSDSFSCQ